MGPDVVTIGDSVVDLIIQVPRFPTSNEETVQSKGITYQLGGSSNFLITSSRLGLNVGVIDQVGDDDLGSFYKSNLLAEGVNVSHLDEAQKEQTAHCICLVDQRGNHSYISFPGATYNLSPNKIVPEIIESAKVLYISGYSLTQGTIRDATIRALEIAVENQVTVYFDPSPRVVNIPVGPLRQVIERSHGLFLNEREFDTLNGVMDVSPQEFDFMVLKQGENGCTVFTKEGSQQYPGEAVDVLDTTGAGDVFNSAFIYGLTEKWSLKKCARFANILAAEKVKTLGGGMNVPTRDRALELLSTI